MAVVVADFLLPRGPIDAALLFPNEQQPAVERSFSEWIAQGAERAAKYPAASTEQREDVTRAWVLYRTYDVVTDRMSNTPATFSTGDDGSVSFTGKQLSTMSDKRDYWLDEYNGLVSALGAKGATTTVDKPTVSVPARFGW